MEIQSLDQSSSYIMDVFIRILPVGVILGLAVVLLLRLVRYIRRKLSERAATAGNVAAGLGETVSGIAASVSVPTAVLVIDVLLFLYILFYFDWASVHVQLKGSWPYLWLLLAMPHIAALYLIKAVGPFVLAVAFFGLLGGCFLMTRFYVGPWPRRFQLSSVVIFLIVLAWLTFRWGQTAWGLARPISGDTPAGLQGMLMAALFSPCSPRVLRADPVNFLGPSIGMSMLEWLAAIYLTEKYLRLAIFHERREELGVGAWMRFAPVMPMLLLGAFVGYGLWGNLQRGIQVSAAERIERVVLLPKHKQVVWQEAVEQCAARGSDWRLPTQHELRLLSRRALASRDDVRSAWTAELHPEHGAYVLRWKEEPSQRSTFPANMFGRCLTPTPSDLYQRLVTALYPALYRDNKPDNFSRYFYPGEAFNSNSGIRGDLPEAVICVKSTVEADQVASVHVMKDAVLVRDTPSASGILKDLCNSTTAASGPCQTLVTQRVEPTKERDPAQGDDEFKARQEKCRATADPGHCTSQGWHYRVQGQFDRALFFFDWGCQKGDGNACLDVDRIREERAEFHARAEELVQLGYAATAPLHHDEAKDPLVQACEQGYAAHCLYRGTIANWENQRPEALRFYAKGCTGGVLLSCTKQVHMEWADAMIKDYETAIIPKYVALCDKKEPLACLYLAGMLSDKIRGPRAAEGLALAKQRCAEGMPSLCEFYENSTNANRWYVPNEMQAADVRPDSPYDIEGLQASCTRYALSCKGSVERLANQGQFKEAEWFRERACIEEKAQDVKSCSQRIPWRTRFAGMTDLLRKKKYFKAAPQDHAAMLPVLKKACQDGVKETCVYVGDLMYDVMTERSEGEHSQYTLAGLKKPFERACQLDDVSACKHALDLGREWRDGPHSAEKEQSRRPATVEEARAYGRLCEERNYAGACWEVLQPWLDDRKQDHRQVPEHLAPAWRYTAGLCEKRNDTTACWTLLKPSIDALEHDHSKLPTDRSQIRRLLERICKIEAEENEEDKRACRELQRYLDLHWL